MTANAQSWFARLLVLLLLLAGVPVASRTATASIQSEPDPVTSHPRIWITQDDLPRLRTWATDDNPFWRDGLAIVAEDRKALMDNGIVPAEDDGSRYWQQYPIESHAELFAFLSLVDPDEAARSDYAQRARTLLMHAMNEAVKGPADSTPPFRDPAFVAPHSDRARWWGEGWALTVDWIYPTLSAEDKATIRRVFLRWAEEIVTEGYHHPEPVGLTNDSSLVADPTALRWSGNNYFLSHMRNIGLMALAFDPADDPGGELGAYLDIAIGAHLFMNDHLLRTDGRGGLAPEGFEYSPQALAYIVQFQLALRTAGRADPAVWGPHVVLDDNPFWDELIPAYLNSLGPEPVLVPGYEYMGPMYQPAWYGDGQVYWAIDMIELLGPLALHDRLTGNADRPQDIRWIQANMAPGGAEHMLADHVANPDNHLAAIFYFLLFDPAAPAPADPRIDTPPAHFSAGIGRLNVRTSWDADAAWFNYGLGWIAIDHQFGDGNGFGFFRNGEWLTKGLVGYGSEFDDGDPTDDFAFATSENQNSLGLKNDRLGESSMGDYRGLTWEAGSQWEYDPAGDPTILALSVAPGYTYVLGDATNLYNSTYEDVTDILHASRSIVWLAPDVIVVYDRAESKTDGRFKRFWLNLPNNGTVDGNVTSMTTSGGQQLSITTLLPADATPAVLPLDIAVESLAVGEPMRYQFLVEAPGGPRETRFLNVLQAADAGVTITPARAIASDDGQFAGTVVGTTAVLFPVEIGTTPTGLTYTAPSDTTTHLITGLAPDGGYDVATTVGADGIAVTVTEGSTYRADGAGALLVGSLPEVLTEQFAFTNPLNPIVFATPESEEADTSGETGTTDETEDTSEIVPVASPVAPVTEGGAAATGAGQIVYKVYDGETSPGHLFRIDAVAGSMPEDISAALDALPEPGPDDWISISPDGEWLLMGTERFDPNCAGWPCLALVKSDLTSAEVIHVAGEIVHSEGPSVISGDVIVVSAGGGPHQSDLWAIQRQGDAWSAPRLLTGDSAYAFHAEPAIATDGSSVVFECGDQPYGEAGTAVCEVATDGAGFRIVLTPGDVQPGAAATGALRHPSYAPSGEIVFHASWTGTIWSLPDGGATVPVGLPYENDNAPCVLPDGRIATLWLGRPGSQSMHELKVMTSDGAAYVVLVAGVDIEQLSCGG